LGYWFHPHCGEFNDFALRQKEAHPAF